jgi:hypothetical protein
MGTKHDVRVRRILKATGNLIIPRHYRLEDTQDVSTARDDCQLITKDPSLLSGSFRCVCVRCAARLATKERSLLDSDVEIAGTQKRNSEDLANREKY